MAEFWIQQQAGGRARGPVSSAQLRRLAKQGSLHPSDRIGKSREGPWNRADSLPGLNFEDTSQLHFAENASGKSEAAGEELPDFDAMMQTPSGAPAPVPGDVSESGSEVVRLDAGESRGADQCRERWSALGSVSESIRLNFDRTENKYPALRLIAKAHRTMGVVSLFLAAISLVVFLYFLSSHALSGSSTPAEPNLGRQPVHVDDLADQLQQQLLQASSQIEAAQTISTIWGSFFLSVGLAWGGILCLAFAQIIMLFLDIERNTRRE